MARAPKPPLLKPAQNLLEVGRTFEQAPLLSKAELDAFYREEVQRVRGEDRMGYLKVRIEDALAAGVDYRGFLMGHPGVGKTTELMRVIGGFSDQLEPLRISILSELNPGAFRYYDLLLLILIRVVEKASSAPISGFEENNLKTLMTRVRGHLSTKWTKHLSTMNADWGAGLKLPFTQLFGNLRQGRIHEKGEQEYEISFVTELTELTNDVLDACNDILESSHGKRWIILIEDFDKLNLPTQTLYDVFLGLRPSLQSMRTNLILTIPVWLFYSDDFQNIRPYNFDHCVVPDIPVYTRQHIPDDAVIAALTEVVHARIAPSLLEDGVLRRCILASGGFLRDLFALIVSSTVFARLRGASTVGLEDADKAIVDLRNNYKQRLGTTIANPAEPTVEQKLNLLVEIYNRNHATAEIANLVMYKLLQQRFVLQYNGVSWLGIHPLAVDLLIHFEYLDPGSPGGSDS